jgi:HD-GYP domain-containing protein (c-di-GMP phosphodiesterase class II)
MPVTWRSGSVKFGGWWPKRPVPTVTPLYCPVSVSPAAPTIETADLRVGMFVHLDLGWMSHPFALSSFRIADASQIATIRSLGLARVRWSPEKSEVATSAPPTTTRPQPLPGSEPVNPPARRAPVRASNARRMALTMQRAAVELCQRQYREAALGWREATEQMRHDPQGAGQRLAALSRALVDKMLGAREVSIRVLAETAGDQASHALNVGVISLLMGKLCGLAETDLHDLGVGALSHDIGKIELPPRLHRSAPDFTAAEMALYREHVAHGVVLGKRMGLSPGGLLVIAQHHEHCDGSGFPQKLDANRMSMAARVVALVNRYDNLCHPVPASRPMTPHEALSLLFTQGKHQYDGTLLTSFVRMMGVYPPGSVVQLTDDRFALVDSVNSSRPLKPRVMVHDPGVAHDHALLLDLENEPALGIRRSLPSSQLPRSALEVLMPPPRVTWYFETTDGGRDAEDAEPDVHH